MKKIIISITTALCLLGCGGEDSQNNSNTPNQQEKTSSEIIQQMERNGELPVLDRSTSIEGIDLNNNHIRDDIEEYIAKEYTEIHQRKAVEQLASTIQLGLNADKTDIEALKQVSNNQSRAIGCIYQQFPMEDTVEAKNVVKDLISLTTNTKERLVAYLEMSKALDGTVLSLPKGDLCDD